MTEEKILLSLRQELKSIKPKLPDNLPANSHFKNDWQLDSLELVEFVARIEQHFGILIPDEDLPGFITLEATTQYVQNRLPA
ncbi:MAG TPA: phosphopantetheine-binding protein [Saprospiraceae bacterium]|nr:phosphopantetheine-binding protein [Saprospiraceae bacterium]